MSPVTAEPHCSVRCITWTETRQLELETPSDSTAHILVKMLSLLQDDCIDIQDTWTLVLKVGGNGDLLIMFIYASGQNRKLDVMFSRLYKYRLIL